MTLAPRPVAPAPPVAAFRQAVALYQQGREAEAEAACRDALAHGFDHVDAWLFLARLYHRQARFEAAEHALRTAVRCDPASLAAHRELAQLVWMRTGDLARARAALDAAPKTSALVAVTVRLLQEAGEEEAAYRLAAEGADRHPGLAVMAARAALRIDPQDAERRLAAAPPTANPVAKAKGEIEADLALGRAASAAIRAEALHAAQPGDHYVAALLAAAWRLAGDPRHGRLYDYARLVGEYRIEAPPGWPNLDAYLADLAAALDRVHAALTHPVGQSLRHGSQTLRDLRAYPNRAIQALFPALDAPIRRHIGAIGETVGHRILGSWSVRLNRQGFHIDHIHPEGWLSSAFYVRLPAGLQDREGWIKFGEPGTPTAPPLPAEHFVAPEPGKLVLFPSYMWHGTVPFEAEATRLACAFDIVRAG